MKVYKYRGGADETFERDLFALENDFFWAPNRVSLNDPCEGLYRGEILNLQLDFVGKLLSSNNTSTSTAFKDVRAALQEVLSFVDRLGIYALSKTPNDELLWAHYATGHSGFCIEYNLETLRDFGKNDYQCFDVSYEKSPPALNIHDLAGEKQRESFFRKLIGAKSKRWSYEKEVRVISSQAGKKDYDFRAVNAIYFGVRMDNSKQKEIMKRMAGRELNYYQAHIAPTNYDIRHTVVADQYARSPRYKYSIAPIAEYAIAPEYAKKDYREYFEYMYRAAEIVRREPYCNLVEMVEFSFDKSTPERPVIFVQYRRSEHRCVNHYLTIQEIDEKYRKITDLDPSIAEQARKPDRQLASH